MSNPTVVKAGPHPLLVKYLAQLALHPLRTKAITTGMVTQTDSCGIPQSNPFLLSRNSVFLTGGHWKQRRRDPC